MGEYEQTAAAPEDLRARIAAVERVLRLVLALLPETARTDLIARSGVLAARLQERTDTHSQVAGDRAQAALQALLRPFLPEDS